MLNETKLVYGWGINDVDYNVYKYVSVGSKQLQIWVCPYYMKWRSMLRRCFCPNLHLKSPTYIGCTVYEEWKHLSSFIKWVDSQPNRDWENCELDKDFLVLGNKHYSPETVVFVTRKVNSFITNNGRSRGLYMIGVNKQVNGRKHPYRTHCCNPFTRQQEYLGNYPTEIEAHKAWQAKKHELACQLADLQEDPRVAKALRERYAPDKDWTKC